MAITDLLDGLASAMVETKKKLGEVNAVISELEGERNRIVRASPHTDDLVAAFMRGLKKASESFERRLGWHLNSMNLADGDAAATVQRSAGQFLMLKGAAPTAPLGKSGQLFPHSGLAEHQADIDVAAVTYFLRDKIAEEIPALIEKVCPSAKSGMKQADRVRALQEVDAKLAEQNAERERLTSEINAAIKAVSPAR